jgi:LysM domain-containing protein
MKLLFPIFTSVALVISQGLTRFQNSMFFSATPTATETQARPADVSFVTSTPEAFFETVSLNPTAVAPAAVLPISIQPTPAHAFGNPAGCAATTSPNLSANEMLANVQSALGNAYNLAERRQWYIWNGPRGTYMNVSQDPYIYEFVFNSFQPPLTYRADQVVTIFLNNGFVVWLRSYGENFRLTAVPMVTGVLNSAWAEYVTAYWQESGKPNDDYIYPVMKKLPCHWVLDAGYVTNEILQQMFKLDWHIPDYLSPGRQYLAGTCKEAYQVSQEKIGYRDAASMCGPLAWTIMRDANGFPYRIGSWTVSAGAFTAANPRSNGQPWGTFDPDTFTLMHTDNPMPGYDFEQYGNLYPGDLLYSYATLYVTSGYFDHIFIVAGIDENNTRLSITNMIRNAPFTDCSIAEIPLYTPGDREHGVINHEWNGYGFGQTGTTGFDVFRWNWITYHLNAQPIQYEVRWGDTLETIAFDWKIPTEEIAIANALTLNAQLTPGQSITLPVPFSEKKTG